MINNGKKFSDNEVAEMLELTEEQVFEKVRSGEWDITTFKVWSIDVQKERYVEGLKQEREWERQRIEKELVQLKHLYYEKYNTV